MSGVRVPAGVDENQAKSYELAFEEAGRALDAQERAVNALRSRAGVLIAAAAITTSFYMTRRTRAILAPHRDRATGELPFKRPRLRLTDVIACPSTVRKARPSPTGPRSAVNHGHDLRFAHDDVWSRACHIGAMRATESHSYDDRSVHVVPGRRGVWIVRSPDDDKAASVHPSTTHAERAAHLLARTHGATRVVVHDRDCRLRTYAVERA